MTARFHARYYLDEQGAALALADLEAETLEQGMAEALKRATGFVARPSLVILYENNIPVARCVDCFDDKGGTWSLI